VSEQLRGQEITSESHILPRDRHGSILHHPTQPTDGRNPCPSLILPIRIPDRRHKIARLIDSAQQRCVSHGTMRSAAHTRAIDRRDLNDPRRGTSQRRRIRWWNCRDRRSDTEPKWRPRGDIWRRD